MLCRGIAMEGAGGRRRCAAVIGDRDVAPLARRYVAAFTVRGRDLFFVKGSAPEEGWPGAEARLRAAVGSFALPAAAARA